MTATDLRFVALQEASTALRFGDSGASSPVYIDLTLAGVLTTSPATGSLDVVLDNAVNRAPAARVDAGWRTTAAAAMSISVPQPAPDQCGVLLTQSISDSVALDVDISADWRAMSRLGVVPNLPWSKALATNSVKTDLWDNLNPRLRPGLRAIFEAAAPRSARPTDTWISLHRERRPLSSHPWTAGRSFVRQARAEFSPALRFDRSYLHPWSSAAHPMAGLSRHDSGGGVQPTPPCYVPPLGNAVALAFRARQLASPDLAFKCPGADGPVASIVVPVRSIYMQTNTVSLVLAESGQPIPARDLHVGIDVDSWCWGWSASVPAGYFPLLSASGQNKVEVLVSMNGTSFRLAVERLRRNRKFADAALTVSGRGRAAWLADPYAEVVSRSNGSAMTAQQLMADALTINGAPSGWDIDWQITDWLVPAGAWNHTGTAMEACIAIANAAGAYIQAHRTEQVLSVLPRYKMAPWHWSSMVPDIELPEDACETEGIEWLDKPDYNAVFISGYESGVLAHVTRQGSAGDRCAPDIVDPLITHADAGRQRGTAVLSDTGSQALISLSGPVLPETGIIVPGKLLRYTEGGKQHVGLSRAVDVNYNLPVLTQTIQVESHVI